jgi:PAS domain S-box-containing protein
MIKQHIEPGGAAVCDPAARVCLPGRLARLPLPVFLLAIAALWAADSRTVYESPYLLIGLNLFFSALVSLLVAYLVGRSFLARGRPGLLLLGCGVLFWGVSGLVSVVANLLKGGPHFDVNVAVTIHNLCVWASALCHWAGAAFSLRWELSLRSPLRWLVGGYAAALAIVGLIVLAALLGWTPDFFVQGQGGTPVRQFVLGSAIAMFVSTALWLRAMERPRRSAFVEWYVLALLLLSVGYLGVLLQPVRGGWLGWTGRAAQFLGGGYMLAAAVATLREPGLLGAVLGPARRDATRHRYIVAVALTAAAAIVRLVFLQALGTQAAFVTFYPAVMVSALYGGLRPGLLAAALSACLAGYFWVEPVGVFAIGQASGWLSIAVFLLSCAMISAITESMHRAHARARGMAAQAAFAGDPVRTERDLRTRERRLAEDKLKAIFPANAVFALAIAMLAALSWFSYRHAAALLQSEQEEGHAYAIIGEFDQLLAALTTAEAGERGFLVAGDGKSLALYRQALGQVTKRLAALDALTLDNPRQRQRLRALEGPIADGLGELERSVTVRREQGFEAAQRMVIASRGRDRLEEIRQWVGEIQEEERRLRQQRMAAKADDTRNAIQTGSLGVLLGFAMLGLVYGLLRREIAERKRAEAEVFAQRNRLKGVVESLPEFIWTCLPDGAMDYVSPQWFEYTGVSEPDALGEGWLAVIHPDDREEARLAWRGAVREGGFFDREFRIRRADGEYRWFKARAIPQRDGEGRLAKWFGCNTDIDDSRRIGQELLAHRNHLEVLVEARTAELAQEFAQHKEAEEALRANEERMRLVLQASSTGTFEIDFQSGKAQWNDVEFELLGLKPGEVAPSPENFFRFVHPADLPALQASWEAAVRGGHLDAEFRIVRADGEERWLAGRGRFAFGEESVDARGPWFLGVNFDITDHKRTEERLRRSEAGLAKAQSIANIGSWEWDVPSGELRWSDQMYRIFGEEPQAFAPSFGGFMARVHPDDVPRLDGVFNDAVARGVPFCLEHQIVTRQGGGRLVLAQVEIELAAGGRVARILGTVSDITERKQAEATRARLAAIVEFSQDAIIGKNLDGTVTSWNRGAEKLFGYAAEEIIGRPFACVVPSERMEEEMGILARLRRGEAVEHFETERLRKDGTIVPVAITVSPVRDQDGRVIGVSKIARDISERKRVEEERNAYIALVKTSADFIGMCDNDFVPFFVNEAGLRLVGLDSLEEARRKTVKEFFFPEDQPFIEGEFFAKVLREGRGEVEIRFRHFKTGEALWMIYNVFILRDLSGESIGFATVSRDITARKQAQDALAQQASRLREADRHKDEFLAMLAHELRNPLTPIMIAVQMLEKRGGEDPALVRWAGDTVRHQCEHLTQLVNQLLDVSRVSRGKITLSKSLLDLGELVGRAVEAARPMVEQSRHTLELSLQHEPLLVDGDAIRLEQVLGNLLNNAAKYTPEGGRISVRLSREGAAALLRVKDNGVGMSAAMLPKVFDLFTQAERTLDRSQGGLGIGLALVKNLVELHGGSVSAASPGAGQGSEFAVRLPLSAASSGGVPARCVLVVEDNEFVLASLSVLLKTLGHEVHVARNGQEALDIAGWVPLDLALIDIGLPGLNGYEVVRRLRKDFPPGTLTLVAMTGYNQEEDRQNSKNAGFDIHLAKPFDPAELEKILADLGAPPAAGG